MTAGQEVATWVSVVLSAGLAAFFPLAAWRHLRKPESLREAWLYSRPGWIVTGCVVALIFLTVSGLLMAVLAQVYPFMWGTVALFVGVAAATALYLVRFVSFDPREAIESLPEPGDDTTEI